MKKNNSIAQQKTVSFIPDQPELGYSKIYAKDDNNWYYLDDTGVERAFVTSEDINQPPAVVTFAQAATGAKLLFNPVYDNGPLNDGVGATLTASSPGIVSDGTSSGKIDFTYTPVNGGVILVWYENASTNPALNRQFTHGLYEITDTGSPSTNYVLTRLAEFDESAELFPLQINITDGTNYLGKYFIQKTPSPIIGTDKLIFVISSNQNSTPPIAFVDTATTTALPPCTYTPGTALTSLPGSGATLTANSPGALGTIGGLTAETSASIITGFTRVLVKDQIGPLAYQNGDYQVINKGSGTQPWVLRRIQNGSGGFSRYTRFFLVSNTGSTQAGKLYFTTPNSPALTNATIGTAPINIVEYGGSGGGGGVIAVGSASGSTVRIGNSNSASCLYSTVSGGQCNTAQGCHATISGGFSNTANGSGSINGGFSNLANGGGSIGGGTNNSASGVYATIGGGLCNIASGCYSAIGGGNCNNSSGCCSTVSGGYRNCAIQSWSTIGGGCTNCATCCYSSVGGGYSNRACSMSSTISGGSFNTASGYAAAIGGGYLNRASGQESTVSGGTCNLASGLRSFIGSGGFNTSSNCYSIVVGGGCNTASGNRATISGGRSNTASGCYSSNGGGRNNTASGDCSTVGGGTGNAASNTYAVVSGGARNTASGCASTVSGGYCNISSCVGTTISGGVLNTASCYYSTISGGQFNIASGNRATISGGRCNTANGGCSTIGGGELHTVSSARATVGGGALNCIASSGATIGGGFNNKICTLSSDSTIGGGNSNTASCYNSTIGGGYSNSATRINSTIGGGSGNIAAAQLATIAGGNNNTTSGCWSTVSGGITNTSSGCGSMISGGATNTANGAYSAILGGSGNNMTCNYSGAFGCNITSVAACTFHVNNLAIANVPTQDQTATDYLVRDNSTGIVKYKSISSPIYGLYAQTALGTQITGTVVETSLVGTGVGTLTVPPNAFKVGDSFTAKMCGYLSCANNETIHIRIKADGNIIGDLGVFQMDTTTNKFFDLNIDFTVTKIGVAGVAELFVNGQYSYNHNTQGAIEGNNFGLISNTLFDTTILNTLSITAEWGSASTSNSIQSQNFVLSKVF
jgi:hypothetical protein